jgi:hypothetical protein
LIRAARSVDVISVSLGRVLLASPALVALIAASACVLGDEDAGCRSDAECSAGFSCRAGACFRFTTAPSPPRDPRDGGDGGDSGDPADAALDAPEDV